ncbi:MAG: DUF502 domain-containing protein [Phycisphaerales bacterium]|nr:MAG: DUF502 domain-containing protein [Phycisphaerales bacterium]
MSNATEQKKKTRQPRLWTLLKALIRSRIRTGIIVLVPVAFTVWVLQLVFRWLDGLLQPLAQKAIPLVKQGITGEPSAITRVRVRLEDLPDHARALLQSGQHDALVETLIDLRPSEMSYLLDHVPAQDILPVILQMVPREVPGAEWVVPGAGLVALFLLLYLVGFLTSGTVVNRFVALFDRFLEKVPISRTIYTASKQVVKTLGAADEGKFKRAVLIPYPCAPLRALAFVTNTFTDQKTGASMTSVFLPTTPNPTSGFYLLLPSSEVRELALNVEQAVGLIMSGGIMLPTHPWTLAPSEVPPGMLNDHE